VVNGNVQDLRVSVTPLQSRFAAVQNVKVVLKYSNDGGDTMSIDKWYLPEDGHLFDPIFEVTLDGEHVEYVGPIAKRPAPTAEDVITLTPGMAVSAVVELSSVYNMTVSGNYIIQYKVNADQVLFTADGMIKHQTRSLHGEQASVLESAPAVVFSIGHRNSLIEQANEARSQPRAIQPTFTGCTSSQSSQLTSALLAAETLTNNAMQYLNGQATTRYTTWFGRHSDSNWLTLKSHFTKLQSTVKTKSLSFDCTCPTGRPVYAYVYANQPYRIYLCSVYWPSVATGTDSKSGTILHELAHFSVVAGTGDHSYGQSACRSLAQTNPSQALRNSDSLQYFAENNPRLS